MLHQRIPDRILCDCPTDRLSRRSGGWIVLLLPIDMLLCFVQRCPSAKKGEKNASGIFVDVDIVYVVAVVVVFAFVSGSAHSSENGSLTRSLARTHKGALKVHSQVKVKHDTPSEILIMERKFQSHKYSKIHKSKYYTFHSFRFARTRAWQTWKMSSDPHYRL